MSDNGRELLYKTLLDVAEFLWLCVCACISCAKDQGCCVGTASKLKHSVVFCAHNPAYRHSETFFFF